MKAIIGSIVAILVVAGVLWLVFSRTLAEPVYGGKTRSEWLATINGGTGGLAHRLLKIDSENSFARKDTIDAIKAMGTNQIPYYLELVGTHRSSLVWNVRRLLAMIPLLKFDADANERLSQQAGIALFCLGTNAAPARAELLKLLAQRETSTAAAHALASQASEVISEVIPLLSHTNEWISICAVWLLAQATTNSAAVVTNTAPLLAHANPAVRQITLWSLSQIDIESKWSVGAFSNAIVNPASPISETVVNLVENSPLPLAARQDLLRTAIGNSSAGVRTNIDRALKELEAKATKPAP